jgi:hypothetical protein
MSELLIFLCSCGTLPGSVCKKTCPENIEAILNRPRKNDWWWSRGSAKIGYHTRGRQKRELCLFSKTQYFFDNSWSRYSSGFLSPQPGVATCRKL